jgi:hypothetical protein
MKMPFDLNRNYELPKRPDEAWSNSPIYWDNTRKHCTTDNGGTKQVGVMIETIHALIGFAVEPADRGSETGLVKLNCTEFY